MDRAAVKLGISVRAHGIGKIWRCSVLRSLHVVLYGTTSEPHPGDKSSSSSKEPPSPGGSVEKVIDAPQSPDQEEQEQEYRNPHTGEIGGPKGPEPTRYGDWEKGGRCSDF
eukprot:c19889_g1_i1 orf=144-476(+)